MDNLTHSLVGALLGQAGLKRTTGLAMPALIIGANIPDIDATCVIFGTQSLAMRRGLTHGPIAWVVLPLLLATALWGFDRWQARRGRRPAERLPVRFGWLLALSLAACLTHPALDWLNSYGIRFLEPFSERWFYGDTLFIVDVWLWLAMGAAVIVSRRREWANQAWRRPAAVALLGSAAYIGANLSHSHAVEAAYARSGKAVDGGAGELGNVIAAPVPVKFWQREVIVGRVNDWAVVPAGDSGGAARPVTTAPCRWPDTASLTARSPDLAAFLFWSRAPYVERGTNGGIVFHDARFASPFARDRFAVAFPDVPCEATA